jgi:hypothetical protein
MPLSEAPVPSVPAAKTGRHRDPRPFLAALAGALVLSLVANAALGLHAWRHRTLRAAACRVPRSDRQERVRQIVRRTLDDYRSEVTKTGWPVPPYDFDEADIAKLGGTFTSDREELRITSGIIDDLRHLGDLQEANAVLASKVSNREDALRHLRAAELVRDGAALLATVMTGKPPEWLRPHAPAEATLGVAEVPAAPGVDPLVAF